jgi:MFS family permease
VKLTDSWEALREKNFRWLFIARTISLSGASMAPVALAFAVLDVGGTAKALGLVLAGRTTALVVFLLVSGIVSDRFPRRLVLIASHAVTALTQGLVAWLVISGNATVASVFVLECLNGAVSAFTMPALQGVVAQVVPRRLLQQANALMSFARNGTLVVGPAVAGVVVAGPGAGWALAVNALAYAGAALALTRLVIPPIARTASSMVRDLRDGWAEFTRYQWLWVIVVAFGFLNAIHMGVWMVLGPFVAKQHPDTLGERGWGLVLAAEAAGAILMTLVLMRGQLRHPLRAGMAGVSLIAVPLVLLGVAPTVVLLVPAAFVAGAGIEVFGTGWNVSLMENVPPQAMSRVVSYDMLGSYIAIPVGTTVFGALSTVSDPRWLAGVAGVGYLVICLATLALPSVWRLERVAAGGPVDRSAEQAAQGS